MFLELFGGDAVVPFEQGKASRHLGFLQEVFDDDEGSCYRGALLRGELYARTRFIFRIPVATLLLFIVCMPNNSAAYSQDFGEWVLKNVAYSRLFNSRAANFLNKPCLFIMTS